MMKKHILFVDNDEEILTLIKAKLNKDREHWDIEFVGGGAKALSKLESSHYDAIISDIEMPGMTGVELLRQVKTKHPGVVRILHSGQSSKEVSIQSQAVSHQYLRKPWGVKELRSSLQRAFELQELLGSEELKNLVSDVDIVPSLPASYHELMEEIQSEEPRPHVVGEIISRDVGMAVKILKLVNSSYFGLSVRVADPVHATKLLGLDTIKALALTHSAFSQFSALKCKAFSIDDVVNHSIEVGRLAKRILEHEGLGKEEASDANIAGILHDVGKLVLAQSFPEKYDRILATAKVRNRPPIEVEKETLGTSHAEVGAYLVGVWKLPQKIVETVAFHHNPGRCGELAMDALVAVHVADYLLDMKSNTPKSQTTLYEEALQSLSLDGKMEEWNTLVKPKE